MQKVLLYLAAALLAWFSLHHYLPLPLRSEAFGAAWRLIWSVIFIWSFGFCICQCRLSTSGKLPQAGEWFLMRPHLLHLAIGQSVLAAYIYLRTPAAALVEWLSGCRPPLYSIELYLFFLLTLLCLWRQGRLRELAQQLSGYSSSLTVYLSALIALCILIAQRELPREVSLSSDPDQHAFWAMQVLRLGGVPAHQGSYGPLPFGYPGGFAALNAVWCLLSGLSTVNVVSIQPMLQAQLAILGLLTLYLTASIHRRLSLMETVSAVFFIEASYWLLFPLNLENRYYHLEHTGICSSFSFIALCGASSFWLLLLPFGDKEQELVFRRVFFELAVLCFSLLLLINPVNALISAALLGLSAAITSAREIHCRQHREIFRRVFTAVFALFFIFIDPYYAGLLKSGRITSPVAAESSPLVLNLHDMLHSLRSALLSFQHWSRAWQEAFSLNLVPSQLVLPATSVILLVLFLLLLRPSTRPRFSSAAICLISIPLVLFLEHLFLLPIFELYSGGSMAHLLLPYFGQSSQQWLSLWLFSLLSIMSTTAAGWRWRNWSCGAALLLLFFPLGRISFLPLRNPAGTVNYSPRHGYCGSMGCVSADDKKVLKQLESLYTDYRKQGGSTNPDLIPKVLIPNSLEKMGSEHWLFPYGAGRIAPLYNTFPAAFFYFQGREDYSYEHYEEKVCRNFDRAWLLKQNIRFLFLPSQRGRICLEGLKEKENKERIIYKSGNSYLLGID